MSTPPLLKSTTKHHPPPRSPSLARDSPTSTTTPSSSRLSPPRAGKHPAGRKTIRPSMTTRSTDPRRAPRRLRKEERGRRRPLQLESYSPTWGPSSAALPHRQDPRREKRDSKLRSSSPLSLPPPSLSPPKRTSAPLLLALFVLSLPPSLRPREGAVAAKAKFGTRSRHSKMRKVRGRRTRRCCDRCSRRA